MNYKLSVPVVQYLDGWVCVRFLYPSIVLVHTLRGLSLSQFVNDFWLRPERYVEPPGIVNSGFGSVKTLSSAHENY